MPNRSTALKICQVLTAFTVVYSFILINPHQVLAHRSGCHRWHSCPSDTGSYVCGDLGYTSGCPGTSDTAEQSTPTPASATPTPKPKVTVTPKPTVKPSIKPKPSPTKPSLKKEASPSAIASMSAMPVQNVSSLTPKAQPKSFWSWLFSIL